MRIAFIHPFLYRYPRGIERYTLNLANALAQAGAEVHILTWRWPQPVQIGALDPRVHVALLPTSRYYAAQAMVPLYSWHLLRERFDFVWIFFAGYGEAEALTLLRGQPFGAVFHFPQVAAPDRYREFGRYGLIGRAQQIVSVSQVVADSVREHFGLGSTVIHHGVDAQQFAPDASARARVRHRLGLGATAPLLVTAAALEERKGVQHVLRALPAIRQARPDLAYAVLGEGPYRPALEGMANDLGVAGSVHFLGATDAIAPFYQAADLSVILSRGEASSLVALESLACGVPVLAADERPFDELIDGGDGVRVAPGDTQAVAGAVLSLLSAPERLRVMGEQGRARILRDFRWDRVAQQYLALISSPATQALRRPIS